jgi:hypothetical protein
MLHELQGFPVADDRLGRVWVAAGPLITNAEESIQTACILLSLFCAKNAIDLCLAFPPGELQSIIFLSAMPGEP